MTGQVNISYLFFFFKLNFCHFVKNDDKITHTETERKSSFITQMGRYVVPQQLFVEAKVIIITHLGRYKKIKLSTICHYKIGRAHV